MREKFLELSFKPKSLALLGSVQAVVGSYERQGYTLSLRQLYYQLVSRNLVENTELSYKRVGDLLNNARLAGLVDWNTMVDRGRSCERNSHWSDPADFLENVAPQFDHDLWEGQRYYVEVMVEKQALEGVLLPVCEELDVPFSSNKGYSSASTLYRASKRLLAAKKQGKKLAVLYLGDHDPSGIDMTRDITDRLALFCGRTLDVERLALNMPQIEEYGPPENPAKMTDSRASAYVEQFGASSWELDALEPSVLAGLVRDAIESRLDLVLFDQRKERREEGRTALVEFAEEYRNREQD